MGSDQAESQVHRLHVDTLAQRCAQETDKFRRHLEYSSAYCFELFRRALVLHNDYAWSKIFEQYRPFVRAWVLSHRAAPSLRGDLDDVINQTFMRLYQAITPERFQNGFQVLPALITYLNRCTTSAILDILRRRERELKTVDDEEGSASLSDLNSGMPDWKAEDLWRWLNDQLQNEVERVVIYASFVLDLTPAEIVAEYPNLFSRPEEVYATKRNVLARLRRNAASANLQV